MLGAASKQALGLALMAPLVGGLPMAEPDAPSPAVPDAAGLPEETLTARERIQRLYFPNVTLVNQHGKEVRFYDDLIKGKIVTINFFYAKCNGICPGETANLAKVQQMFGAHAGRDLFMNSITLKPEQDDPAALKMYADMHDAGPGWNFLTGKPEDIELLRRRLGFTDPDPKLDKDTSNHIGNVRFGNEPLMLWGAVAGLSNPRYIHEVISWMFRPAHPIAASSAGAIDDPNGGSSQ
jgi:protein SCO1/2